MTKFVLSLIVLFGLTSASFAEDVVQAPVVTEVPQLPAQEAPTSFKRMKRRSFADQNKIVGAWHTISVRCVKGKISKAPTMSASVALQIGEKSYTAQGKVGGFSCRFGGPVSQRGSTILFKLRDEGGCPLSDYLKDGFTGSLNGRRMNVTLPTNVADMLCDDQGGKLSVILSSN